MSEGIESLPTEILIHIFTFLKPIHLTKCSRVCRKWKHIVNSFSCKDEFWLQNCKTDFPNMYVSAYKKRLPGLNWCNIYRSLMLWPYLHRAEESMDEFASASRFADEIRDFNILRHGIIGVHTLEAINFYDLETLKPASRTSISGNYIRYVEDQDTIVVHGYNLSLYIVRTLVRSLDYDIDITLFNIKLFILAGCNLYLVSLNDEVCLCKINEKKLQMIELCVAPKSVMSIGVSDGKLNLLTFDRDIYTVVGTTLVYQVTLGYYNNLLHELHKYKFLENLDWRVYFQWMCFLRQPIPHGPLRDIVIIKTYGDAVFVGSNWGVLRIYYSPYLGGRFDIFHAQPVKQYNFMERSDCPVLSKCPILQIDVVESDDGHMVLIGMPKKIAVLKFKHSFNCIEQNSLIPYKSIQINC